MIGMSSRFQGWRVRHRLKWWWNKACSLSDESLVNRCISRPMDTCGQNKAMEISAADVPWSEGQNPKLVRNFSPQNLKNMDLGKIPNPSWGWFRGSPNPKHHLQWRRYKIIEIIPWPIWFSYPLKFRGQFQSFASLSRWDITPMSIIWFFDHGNHQIFRSKSRWKPNHDVRTSWLRPLRLNFRLPRKAAAWHDMRRFATAVPVLGARGWAPPAMR